MVATVKCITSVLELFNLIRFGKSVDTFDLNYHQALSSCVCSSCTSMTADKNDSWE